MAARPSITARAGLCPSHVELVLETRPSVPLNRSQGVTGTWDPVQCPARVPVRKGVWSGLRWHHSSLKWDPILDPGTGFSPESGPGRDQSQDRSQDQTPGPVPEPVLAYYKDQDRSQNWSQDRSKTGPSTGPRTGPGTGPGNPLFVTTIDSNQFQLHPTPVPSAGGGTVIVGTILWITGGSLGIMLSITRKHNFAEIPAQSPDAPQFRGFLPVSSGVH